MTGARDRCLAQHELVDALDGTLPPTAWRMPAACADVPGRSGRPRGDARRGAIRRGARTAAGLLGHDQSPGRRAVDEERAARAGRWGWLRWDTLVPLAGMAAVLVALGSATRASASNVHGRHHRRRRRAGRHRRARAMPGRRRPRAGGRPGRHALRRGAETDVLGLAPLSGLRPGRGGGAERGGAAGARDPAARRRGWAHVMSAPAGLRRLVVAIAAVVATGVLAAASAAQALPRRRPCRPAPRRDPTAVRCLPGDGGAAHAGPVGHPVPAVPDPVARAAGNPPPAPSGAQPVARRARHA